MFLRRTFSPASRKNLFEVTRHFLLPFFHGMAFGLLPCLLSHYLSAQESLLKNRQTPLMKKCLTHDVVLF